MSSVPPTSRVFVHLSFKGKRQDDGTRLGCLTIRYVEAENEFIPGSILGEDSWTAALVPFLVQLEQLSDIARAEIAEAERYERTRAYYKFNVIFYDEATEYQWLKIHKDIIQTLKGFTVRKMNDRQRDLELPWHHKRFSDRLRVSTLEGMPVLKIWASPGEWEQLRQKIQSLPYIPMPTPELINASLEQLIAGMEEDLFMMPTQNDGWGQDLFMEPTQNDAQNDAQDAA
ncbi:hypothetical protein COL922a_002033 [Colletotrichum nupharicola]|nr:hypothetical protein COL922a_002033 [Colletotrichum nupharicola]